MATIGKYKAKDGRIYTRILFVDPGDGKRRTVRLGRVNKEQAATVKSMIERLAKRNPEPKPEPSPEPSRRLGGFLDEYVQSRTDIKPQTAVVLGHTVRNLREFFGDDRALDGITEGDADKWRLYLIGQGLSEATVSRRCGVAKQFFRSALRHKFIPANPFMDLKSTVKANKARQRFISRADAQEVLDACPDGQWRLIFALARFGGLRTPSETLSLKWSDIDWDKGRLTVHSPKTEHHAGHETREVPLFPELRPHLLAAFEEAEPGTEYVITEYRLNNLNLRTQFARILRKAGLQAWPKPFQNLRSTRETELCEQFPEHVVTAWIGNSKAVAREHYLQVRDEDFERATKGPVDTGGAAHRTAQQIGENTRELSQTAGEPVHANRVLPVETAGCETSQVLAESKVGPGRIRTFDQVVMSHLLCR
jgi:integrase